MFLSPAEPEDSLDSDWKRKRGCWGVCSEAALENSGLFNLEYISLGNWCVWGWGDGLSKCEGAPHDPRAQEQEGLFCPFSSSSLLWHPLWRESVTQLLTQPEGGLHLGTGATSASQSSQG